MRCLSLFINKKMLGKKLCVGSCLKCLTVATPLDVLYYIEVTLDVLYYIEVILDVLYYIEVTLDVLYYIEVTLDVL